MNDICQVFLDVTDIIDYNLDIMNEQSLQQSFFHLDHSDPMIGFPFDASVDVGEMWPAKGIESCRHWPSPMERDFGLAIRLRLGSHLAQYLRQKLNHEQGFTSTVGISTNKVLSKLVGNVNKPSRQTVINPPYDMDAAGKSNVHEFMDAHDIGKIPGIGFKTAQKLRTHFLKRPAEFDAGLVYGGTREDVTVGDLRLMPEMGPRTLQKIFNGLGMPRDMHEKIWGLLNGIDDTEVAAAREIPRQISIEDSYIRLNDLAAVTKELTMLSKSLIVRMRTDLTAPDEVDDILQDSSKDETQLSHRNDAESLPFRWIAHPKNLRLSTRPRPPLNAGGSRQRSFARISKSGPMPSFIFNLNAEMDTLAARIVDEALLPLFRQLHPEKSGWDLSLVNVCATSMTMGASKSGTGEGRGHCQNVSKSGSSAQALDGLSD